MLRDGTGLNAYNRQERRVMVRFHLPKDRDTERIQLAMMFMCRDVKHCKNWMCEFCGEPLHPSVI